MPDTHAHNKWTMQVIMNIVKIHVILWKGSNKAAKSKDDLPVIRLKGIGDERPVVPISLCTSLELIASTP